MRDNRKDRNQFMKTSGTMSKNQYQRCIEVKRNIKLLIFSVLLIISLTIGLGSFISKAATTESEIYYKYYTQIEIEANDTLWCIANDYKGGHYENTQAYINEVLTINNRSDEDIRTGEYLIIPYYSKDLLL